MRYCVRVVCAIIRPGEVGVKQLGNTGHYYSRAWRCIDQSIDHQGSQSADANHEFRSRVKFAFEGGVNQFNHFILYQDQQRTKLPLYHAKMKSILRRFI